MIGLLPAEVESIDREARTARVRIPGLTDGASELPEAQFCNPVGDKSEHTEIRVLPGDRVWLAFEGGDTRYPVIVGYRPRQQENGIDWRRFEHANFQFTADGEFVIDAAVRVTINTKDAVVNASSSAVINAQEQATVKSPKVLVDAADSTFTGKVTVEGAFTYQAGMTGKGGATLSGGARLDGGARISGGATIDGSLTNNDKDVGSGHEHGGVKQGSDKSGGPI